MILFGHFERIIWESFPIKNGHFVPFHVFQYLFSQFFFFIYFPKCEGKGSFPQSQINSLDVIVGPDLGLTVYEKRQA